MTDDTLSSILGDPAGVLPSQTSADAPWASDSSGPVALMRAVLGEAARCIERGRQRRHHRLAVEAEDWVRCDSREWPFAFANICDVLGLDVDATRARFLADPKRPADRRQAPAWQVQRGRGRTSVRPPRAASRAA